MEKVINTKTTVILEGNYPVRFNFQIESKELPKINNGKVDDKRTDILRRELEMAGDEIREKLSNVPHAIEDYVVEHVDKKGFVEYWVIGS